MLLESCMLGIINNYIMIEKYVKLLSIELIKMYFIFVSLRSIKSYNSLLICTSQPEETAGMNTCRLVSEDFPPLLDENCERWKMFAKLEFNVVSQLLAAAVC